MTSRNWLYRIDVAKVAYGMDSNTAVRALCTNPAGYVSLPPNSHSEPSGE
jgi:hypothetical protein